MTTSDPQSPDWGNLSWSPWHDFDHARDARLIPPTGGIYRFRAEGQPGLLYIGESTNRWTRLDDLARARHRHTAEFYLKGMGDPGHKSAPYFIICENAGCKTEVSWTLTEHPDKNIRRATEARLIQLHRHDTGEDPPIQYHGRGLAAYLKHLTSDAQ